MVFGFLIERKWLQENREIHDVVPTKKMVPLIVCEITLSGHVREMVFWCQCVESEFGNQDHPIKQPNQRNSEGSAEDFCPL